VSAGIIERESVVGAAVLIVAMGIMALAYSSTAQRAMAGYDVQASFAKAEGVAVGADVRLAGVDVGKVVAQRLDDRFQALLTLRLAANVKLPKDSAALIETDGLLGAKFIALQPGSDDDTLKPGGKFQFTQSSMNVTDILELIVSQAKASRAGHPPVLAQPAQ
jgi:phospholipid/cholesterol/gamma-HCH transport system substrate-binding protein